MILALFQKVYHGKYTNIILAGDTVTKLWMHIKNRHMKDMYQKCWMVHNGIPTDDMISVNGIDKMSSDEAQMKKALQMMDVDLGIDTELGSYVFKCPLVGTEKEIGKFIETTNWIHENSAGNIITRQDWKRWDFFIASEDRDTSIVQEFFIGNTDEDVLAR